MLNRVKQKAACWFLANEIAPATMAVLVLAACLFVLPDPAHADVVDNIINGASKLFFAAIVIILMITGTMMLLQKHIMGLFVLVGAGILVLLIGNTDLVVQFAQSVAKLFGLKWGSTSTAGGA